MVSVTRKNCRGPLSPLTLSFPILHLELATFESIQDKSAEERESPIGVIYLPFAPNTEYDWVWITNTPPAPTTSQAHTENVPLKNRHSHNSFGNKSHFSSFVLNKTLFVKANGPYGSHTAPRSNSGNGTRSKWRKREKVECVFDKKQIAKCFPFPKMVRFDGTIIKS